MNPVIYDTLKVNFDILFATFERFAFCAGKNGRWRSIIAPS